MEHQIDEAHARFCAGDVEAFGAIAAPLLGSWRPPRTKWPGDVEEHLVQDSIEDALLAYWENPGMFDPARGVPLTRFRGMVAQRKLATRICKKRRRRRERTGLGKDFWQKTEMARTVGHQGENDQIDKERARLGRLQRGLTARERAGVTLLRRGIRATEVWAGIVGVEGRPVEEQRREIHNAKVRLLRKLRRLARRDRGGGVSVG